MGNAVAIFDVVYNNNDGEILATAILAFFTTYLLLFLETRVPIHRDVEPWIFCMATVALVGIGAHFNFVNLFDIYFSDFIDFGQSSPIYISLWYVIMFLMIMVDGRLAKQSEGQSSPPNKIPEVKDHLIIRFRVGSCVWRLRNSRLAVSLLLAFFSTICGESWPLPMNTTVASLVLYVIVVGLQVRSTDEVDEENQSKPHLAVL